MRVFYRVDSAETAYQLVLQARFASSAFGLSTPAIHPPTFALSCSAFCAVICFRIFASSCLLSCSSWERRLASAADRVSICLCDACIALPARKRVTEESSAPANQSAATSKSLRHPTAKGILQTLRRYERPLRRTTGSGRTPQVTSAWASSLSSHSGYFGTYRLEPSRVVEGRPSDHRPSVCCTDCERRGSCGSAAPPVPRICASRLHSTLRPSPAKGCAGQAPATLPPASSALPAAPMADPRDA
eukprot:scaffold3181_cov389-Prasinococcus_capsulatus_cf.AAC.17